jgi:hypothetical protein
MVGVGGSEFPLRRHRAAGAVALLLPLLAGCSAIPSMPSLPSMPSWFTSSGSNANAQASAAPNAPGTPMPLDFDCPSVQVRTGAATLTSTATPGDPSATSLRYQVTVGTTARECRVGAAPGTVSLKVGMQGRVILGPAGTGITNIDVPVRFAVVREQIDTKLLSTKLEHIQVTIPPDSGNVLFTHVIEGLDFPIPRDGDLDNYIIYIGFDAASAEPEPRKPSPKRPKAAKPKPPTG